MAVLLHLSRVINNVAAGDDKSGHRITSEVGCVWYNKTGAALEVAPDLSAYQ